MAKQTVFMAHTSHLDLYWFAAMPECIEDAINYCKEDPEFHFVIEAARFAVGSYEIKTLIKNS